MTNEEIAQKLLELHTILLVADYPEDHATRYPRLAYTISRMEESVADLVAEGRIQDEIMASSRGSGEMVDGKNTGSGSSITQMA